MTNHAVSNRADLRERTKTMSRHGDRRGQIADYRDSFETINWLYLLFKCGIKTKTHFEWLLWHWSSLGQLNLEPTRPNGLVGCKVPTDLVKISVKEATHMGFHYIQLATRSSQKKVVPRLLFLWVWNQGIKRFHHHIIWKRKMLNPYFQRNISLLQFTLGRALLSRCPGAKEALLGHQQPACPFLWNS